MKALMNRYSRKGLTAALLAGSAAGCLCSGALAQVSSADSDVPLRLQTDYFGYAASVSSQVGFSDNINLQENGLEEEDVALSTSLTGGIITSTRRFTGVALADLDFSYLIDGGDFRVNQNVGGAGTATISDNWLYFDVSGRTSRQLAGDNARFSANLNAGRNQRVDVHSFSASPYVYHRFADQSSASLRYRFSQTFIGDSGSAIGNGFLNDNQSHEATATYDSGNLLDRVRFGVVGYAARTNQDATQLLPAFGFDQASATGTLEVAVSRNFSLSGAVGYDEISTEDAASQFFDDDALSGFFWRAGFTARPHRNAFVRLQYGERYGDDFVDARVNYALSKRLRFFGGASRTFRTRTQSNLNRFQDVQLNTLEFADQLREGRELSPRALINSANAYSNVLNSTSAQTIGVAVTDQAYAGLSGQYGRTNIAFGANYSDSDFGFRQIENASANLRVTRDLSRRLKGFIGATYRRTESDIDQATCEANPLIFGVNPFTPGFDPMAACATLVLNQSQSTTYVGRIGARYRILENASLYSEFAHTERQSPVDFLEYSENYVLAGVTLDF